MLKYEETANFIEQFSSSCKKKRREISLASQMAEEFTAILKEERF